MSSLPIRWKFALWSATLVGVALLVFAGATALNLFHEQIEAVDLEIDLAGRHVQSLAPAAVRARDVDELVGFQPWLFAAVVDAQGQILRRAEALPESIARIALAHPQIDTVRDETGQAWRVKAFPRGDTTVVLCFTLEEVDEIVRHLLIAFALSLPVVLIVAAIGGWWISGRALGGLRNVTAAAERIRADQLHDRLPVPSAQDEIRRLVDVLNETLGRLQTSFEQSKRFAADAAHELRTPLTIIGGEVTRLLRTPGLSTEAETLAVSVQEEIGRLERITEQMLLLAEFDAGTANTPHVLVDLTQLVTEVCEDAEVLAAASELPIEAEIQGGITVRGDAVHLRRLFLNLLDNAVRYNRAGGKVRCTLAASDDSAIAIVGNSGPEIRESVRQNLFERFYRGDAARPRGGHGLGLSLSREIVRAHGGTIVLASSEPDWTEFRVVLPRPPSTKGSGPSTKGSG